MDWAVWEGTAQGLHSPKFACARNGVSPFEDRRVVDSGDPSAACVRTRALRFELSCQVLKLDSIQTLLSPCYLFVDLVWAVPR